MKRHPIQAQLGPGTSNHAEPTTRIVFRLLVGRIDDTRTGRGT